MNNYYTASVPNRRNWPSLSGDLSADVAIVGAGMTGAATAVELAERGYQVVLLDAKQVGWGATGRNGGQVTGSLSGDNAMLKQLRKTQGDAAADFIWNLRWRGHDIINERVKRYNINCDLKTGHLFTAWSDADLPEFESMVNEAHRRGMQDSVSLLSKQEVHERLDTPLYCGAILNTKNLHLHSLKLCLGEAIAAESLGATIYENTPVHDVQMPTGKPVQLITDSGTVQAQQVVLAGNAYHRLMRRQLAGYLFPATLGNMVTAKLGQDLCQQINRDDNAVYDSRMVLDYFRITQDGRLMFGGGTNYSGTEISDVAAMLRPSMEKTFPALKDIPIDFAWTGSAGIIINRIPMLGRIQDRVYYAQGYSGHGMATSHILAEILGTAISGSLHEIDTFNDFWRWRIPVPTAAGSGLVALGMKYFKLKEQLGQR